MEGRGQRRDHRSPTPASVRETGRDRSRPGPHSWSRAVCPTLAEFGLYLESNRLIAPEIRRDKAGMVTLKAAEGARIYYTTDGTTPSSRSTLYTQPFDMSGGGVVKATVEGDPSYLKFGDLLTVEEFGPAKGGWKVVSVSSEAEEGKFAKRKLMKADYAIDDDPTTEWMSKWQNRGSLVTLVVDMGKSHLVAGLYVSADFNGPWVRDYAFLTSEDGQNWTPVAEGEFGNIKNSPGLQTVHLAASCTLFQIRREVGCRWQSEGESSGNRGFVRESVMQEEGGVSYHIFNCGLQIQPSAGSTFGSDG